ncbi:MAG: gamma-glutamylcyclotransferase family protein [Wenzhouxiangella sp.]
MTDDVFHYLAYGSNLHPARLEQRVGPVQCLGRVCLPGWQLCFDKRGSDGSAKANLRAAPGSDTEAWGAVFRLDRSQYGTLDRFEGCGRGYESFWLDLIVDNKPVSALTYLTPSHWRLTHGEVYDWYRDLVILGARYQAFPDQAIEAIAAVPVVVDPNPDRAARSKRLVQVLADTSFC